MPRLNGSRSTSAPAALAFSAVPSETTTTSSDGSNARSSATTRPMFRSSLNAGTIAMRRSGDTRLLAEPEELEQPPRAMTVRVLLEHALACAAPQLLGAARIVEQLAVGGHRIVGARDDDHLGPRLEPPLDPLDRVGDDRRAGGCELEQPARRRRVDGGVRAPRDA